MALVDAGLQFTLKSNDFISKVAGTASMLGNSGVLSQLGPIGMAVGLGLSVFTMGLRAVNGEPLFPPSQHDQQMEAIANVGSKVDQLDGKMEALFSRMSKEIKFAQAMQ